MEKKAFKGPTKSYIWQSALLAGFLFALILVSTFFIPEFIFEKPLINTGLGSFDGNYWQYITIMVMQTGNAGYQTAGVLFITFWFISNIFLAISMFWFARIMIYAITYERWLKQYINYCTEIVTHCDLSNVKPRVAAIVYVCNDLTPSTIIQTVNQTYKNIDVWLLDDSSKPESIEKVKAFAQQHGYRVCHRPDDHKKAHPTMIGNMFYFLSQHATEYDFIFETGASTLTTNTFVENALKFYYSDIIQGDKIGAISGCGSFYPAKNSFSFFSGVSTAWADANINGSGFRTLGTQMYVNGWAAVYRSSVLASIPLSDIECPSCDVARSYWMALHGIPAAFNPFDFSGKLNTQNIYRYNKQRMKWAGGDAFIFKHYWSKKYPNAITSFFVKTHYLCITITFILGFLFQIANTILLLSCEALFFINFTGMVFITAGAAIIVIIAIIAFIIYKPDMKTLIYTLISAIYECSIVFKKFYKLFIYGFLMGKWSSKSVTIKTSQKLTAKEWFRICLFDIVWIAGVIGLCCIIQFVGHRSPFIVWLNLFTFLAGPSLLWMISSVFAFWPAKSGWDDSMEYFDIAKNDYRFKYVKQSEYWQSLNQK